MTVAQLLDEMDAYELLEWQVFAELEPFGSLVEDIRAGMGPAVTVNSNLSKDAKPVGPLFGYPWHNRSEQKAPETPEERSEAIRKLLQGKSQ